MAETGRRERPAAAMNAFMKRCSGSWRPADRPAHKRRHPSWPFEWQLIASPSGKMALGSRLGVNIRIGTVQCIRAAGLAWDTADNVVWGVPLR